MLIYKGQATDLGEMTEEQAAAVLSGWASWMEKVGASLVDVGTPFGPGASVVDDGSRGDPVALSGYSIVEADDLAEAQGLASGHPFLSEGKGSYAIDIYEMLPVPFQS